MIIAVAFAFAFLAAACLFGWKIRRDWATGRVKVVGGFVDRSSNPGRYYFNIVIQAIVALLFVSVPVFISLALSFPNCSSNSIINGIVGCPHARH